MLARPCEVLGGAMEGKDITLAREASDNAKKILSSGAKLSTEERQDLEEIVDKWTALRNKLALDNMRMVEYIVGKYSFLEEHDDLLQEGFYWMLKALDTYDYREGAKPSTYVYTCVRCKTISFITAYMPSTAKLPRNNLPAAALFRESGKRLTAPELVEQGGVSLKTARAIIQAHRPNVSLDTPVGFEDGRMTLHEIVHSGSDPYDETDNAIFANTILNSNIITDKERKVLKLYFGFTNDGEPCTFRTIGKICGYSGQWAYVVTKSGLEKIRKYLKKKEA